MNETLWRKQARERERERERVRKREREREKEREREREKERSCLREEIGRHLGVQTDTETVGKLEKRKSFNILQFIQFSRM